MRIEVRGMHAHAQRTLDLRAQFDFDLVRVNARVIVPVMT